VTNTTLEALEEREEVWEGSFFASLDASQPVERPDYAAVSLESLLVFRADRLFLKGSNGAFGTRVYLKWYISFFLSFLPFIPVLLVTYPLRYCEGEYLCV